MPQSEDELLARAARDDRAALEDLMLRYYDGLLYHIRAHMGQALRSREEPEDLLQQTFMQATRSIKRYEARPGASFLSWLKGIANNRIREAARKKKPMPVSTVRDVGGANAGSIVDLLDLIAADQSSASHVAAVRELRPAVHLVIAQLESPEQREALRLRHIEGLTVKEIAKTMGCTEGAVRGLIFRASGKLKEALQRASLWMSS